ncbi:dihydrolipoamide acyltransferase [Denitratisoma oestradiolicum]|nr:dihydrolipoamide acyltransferase [Denitratisoma oestradiolicum]
MSRLVEVPMPRYPECWDSCGNCANGDVFVIEVHVSPGDVIRFDDNLITLETGKVSLDIPSPHAGRIVEVRVTEGEELAEGQIIVVMEPG